MRGRDLAWDAVPRRLQSAEEIACARPKQRADPGAVGAASRTRPAPRDQDHGLGRVLAPREVGGRRRAGRRRRSPSRASHVRWRRRAPRQSSSGAMPAQPIATSPWPVRQARPNESVITTPGRDAGELAQPRPMRRADASGSRGSINTVSSPGTLDCVDAGVGADEAVMGLADDHAVLRRGSPRASRRARPGPGAGRGSPASSIAPRGRDDLGRATRTRPSAFETTLWAIARMSRGAAAAQASASHDQLPEIGSRRRSRAGPRARWRRSSRSGCASAG